MKKIISVLFVLALLAFTGCQTYETQMEEDNMIEDETMDEIAYTDVSPMEAKELIDNNPELIIIDVSPNYDEGHLPGAVNYYAGDGSLDAAIPSLGKEAMYLVYCHFESASRAGAQKLVDAGFTNVYRLDGDYSGWVDAGYEIEQ
ncbi:hypothetical protein GF336_00050 [Candidatus Woesearchaeota archaeon]|nr:hypothetical protein [Candidatus Woesearchaeota archaeon]